ncbi:hypothetical protein BHE74_00046184 [Ensete ventricosum]|nr:hypothetical protein BHE74_00046184 [Ensete ventricosum]
MIGDGSGSSRIQTQSLFSYFLSTAQCGGTELSTNKENHTGVGRKEESKSRGDGTLDPKGVTSDAPLLLQLRIFLAGGIAKQITEATTVRGRSGSRLARRQKVRLEAKEEAGNDVGCDIV